MPDLLEGSRHYGYIKNGFFYGLQWGGLGVTMEWCEEDPLMERELMEVGNAKEPEGITIERLVEILPKGLPEQKGRKAIGKWHVSPEFVKQFGMLGAKARILEEFCKARLKIEPIEIASLKWQIFDDTPKIVQDDFVELEEVRFLGGRKGEYTFNIELYV